MEMVTNMLGKKVQVNLLSSDRGEINRVIRGDADLTPGQIVTVFVDASLAKYSIPTIMFDIVTEKGEIIRAHSIDCVLVS